MGGLNELIEFRTVSDTKHMLHRHLLLRKKARQNKTSKICSVISATEKIKAKKRGTGKDWRVVWIENKVVLEPGKA